MYDAWKDFPEVDFPADGAAGKPGLIWIPTSMDPHTTSRSYARTGYYEPAKERPNYSLVTGQKVTKILFASEPLIAESVIVESREDGVQNLVRARKEIILAAGTIHSPQILQLSGVGPRALLKEAGIEVVQELPGVGMFD